MQIIPPGGSILHADQQRSEEELELKIARYRRETQNREVIGKANLGEMLGYGLVTGLMDAPVPGIGWGKGVVKGAVLTGTSALGSTALTEAYLYNSQEGRTALESIMNVGTATVMGALSGEL